MKCRMKEELGTIQEDKKVSITMLDSFQCQIINEDVDSVVQMKTIESLTTSQREADTKNVDYK